MNIMFFKPPIADENYGGGAIHFYQLTKSIASLGHDVGYMAENVVRSPYRHFGLTTTGIVKALLWSDCIYQRLRPTSRRPAWIPRRLNFLRGLLRIPLVWEINAPISEGVILKKYDAIEQRRREKLTRGDGGQVAAAFCVSRETVTYAREVLNIKNAVYMPNGGDQSYQPKPVASEMVERKQANEPMIFWMGSGVLPWEGHGLVLELARWMISNDVAGRIVMAGRDLEHGLDVPGNVLHVGRIEHESISGYLAAADICLCLYDLTYFSKPGIDFYQSPLKLYEYMAAGKPVIGTDVGEIRRTIEHGVDGLLVNNDMQVVGQAIVQLTRDTTLREKMGAAARQKVRRYYNWSRVAQQTITEIQKIL